MLEEFSTFLIFLQAYFNDCRYRLRSCCRDRPRIRLTRRQFCALSAIQKEIQANQEGRQFKTRLQRVTEAAFIGWPRELVFSQTQRAFLVCFLTLFLNCFRFNSKERPISQQIYDVPESTGNTINSAPRLFIGLS